MLAKFSSSKDDSKFEKALEYLESNKASFGIEQDFYKVKLQARLHYKYITQSTNQDEIINAILSIVKSNMENVKNEFQSIQNVHELLISLAIRQTKPNEESAEKTLYGLNEAAQNTTADKAFTPTPDQDLIKHIFASFSCYENHG